MVSFHSYAASVQLTNFALAMYILWSFWDLNLQPFSELKQCLLSTGSISVLQALDLFHFLREALQLHRIQVQVYVSHYAITQKRTKKTSQYYFSILKYFFSDAKLVFWKSVVWSRKSNQILQSPLNCSSWTASVDSWYNSVMWPFNIICLHNLTREYEIIPTAQLILGWQLSQHFLTFYSFYIGMIFLQLIFTSVFQAMKIFCMLVIIWPSNPEIFLRYCWQTDKSEVEIFIAFTFNSPQLFRFGLGLVVFFFFCLGTILFCCRYIASFIL